MAEANLSSTSRGDLREAWRLGFSRNAAALLQIQRVFVPWDDKTFQAVLLACYRRSAPGCKVNERTVCAVLAEMDDDAVRAMGAQGGQDNG